MSNDMGETHVISLGGSVVVPPEGVNVPFLKRFAKLVRERVRHGDRFVIVVGGGSVCRNYIRAASKVQHIAAEDLDWLGIHATRLNAHLLRTIFRDIAHPIVVKNPLRPIAGWKRPVLIGAGWRPGRSTDHQAVMLAKKTGAKHIINISNVDYLYDADPRKNGDAKPVKEMSWKIYRKMVGNRWDPGLNLPFDPIASRVAEGAGLEVILVGSNTGNLAKVLSGSSTFRGSVIR